MGLVAILIIHSIDETPNVSPTQIPHSLSNRKWIDCGNALWHI